MPFEAAFIDAAPLYKYHVLGTWTMNCAKMDAADYRRQIIDHYRPIADCLFQDASSFNKSHVVTIVKSQ